VRALLVVLIAWSLAAPARSAPPLHGAVDGRGLIALSQRYGGALSADLWWGEGVLKAGLGVAVGALSGHDDASSRVFTPLGLSLALGPRGEGSGPLATLRAGLLPGAEKGGLMLGGWASCAIGYRFALGEGASLRLGADGWLLLGEHGGLFWGPFLGLGF
jgi:hypothetical protein